MAFSWLSFAWISTEKGYSNHSHQLPTTPETKTHHRKTSWNRKFFTQRISIMATCIQSYVFRVARASNIHWTSFTDENHRREIQLKRMPNISENTGFRLLFLSRKWPDDHKMHLSFHSAGHCLRCGDGLDNWTITAADWLSAWDCLAIKIPFLNEKNRWDFVTSHRRTRLGHRDDKQEEKSTHKRYAFKITFMASHESTFIFSTFLGGWFF